MSNQTTAVQKSDNSLEFIPYGQQDKIKLSVSMIKNMLAVPTRSGQTCSDKDAFKFIMKCQAKRLNPFEDDCWLIGYDTQSGPAFSQVVGHQAYLKRAELHPEYDGMLSGVVVLVGDEEKELEGDYVPRGAELLGGWCRVMFKTRKHPVYKKCNLETFLQTNRDGKPIGQWAKNMNGMIVKCAEADALRSAFPTMLGGLFLREELSIPISAAVSAPDMAGTSGLVAEMEPPRRLAQPEARPVSDDDDLPMGEEAPKATMSAAKTPQKEVEEIVLAEGKSFDDFKQWGTESGQLSKPDDVDSFETIPDSEAKRIVRVKNLLVKGLRGAK